MKTIAVGDPAPDFTVTASNGEQITLSAYRGKEAVVLFFYPADHSPISQPGGVCVPGCV
ncbi:MAG: redoxin domain-containing protein [Planctomycetales bacterium]